jgi:hypothetical protein
LCALRHFWQSWLADILLLDAENGGEWLFKDGKVEWCRRMQHTADHAEVSELKTVLGL